MIRKNKIDCKQVTFLFFGIFLLRGQSLQSQSIKLNKSTLEAVHVSMSLEKLMGREVVKVIKDSTIDQTDAPTFAKLKGFEFSNGTIEINVLSRLLPNAPVSARGFIGLAFRINNDNSKFESIYIRPTNGRAESQVRRNHSIQYFSYPDYDYERFRKEAPEQYESYADMALNEWIKLKIVVKDARAQLYLNENKQPSLIINDLKHGASTSGSVGLWIDIGTEGFFSDLKISKQPL